MQNKVHSNSKQIIKTNYKTILYLFGAPLKETAHMSFLTTNKNKGSVMQNSKQFKRNYQANKAATIITKKINGNTIKQDRIMMLERKITEIHQKVNSIISLKKLQLENQQTY